MPYHCSLRAWEIRQQKDTCRWYLPFSCKTSCIGAFSSMLSALLSIRILLQVMIIKKNFAVFSHKLHESNMLTLFRPRQLLVSVLQTIAIAIANVVSQTTATLLLIWPMALMQLGTDLWAWDWIGAIQVFNYMLLSYLTIQGFVQFKYSTACCWTIQPFKDWCYFTSNNIPHFQFLLDSGKA